MQTVKEIQEQILDLKSTIENSKIQISMLQENLQEMKDAARLEKLRIAQEYYDRIAAKTQAKIAARKSAA